MSPAFPVFGTADERTLAQMQRCLDAEPGARGALMADNHLGYSAPIGGVIAYREHVSPAAVGYDIGCGNKAVLTDLAHEDVQASVPALMDAIAAQVSFGMGRKDGRHADHPVIDEIARADFGPQRTLAGLAAHQLGTVGAGNHYVDLFRDERDRVWVGVHFGSRGFGHKTASGFLSLAAGGPFDARGPGGGMDAPPVLIRTDSELGAAYGAAMTLAGRYAHAGRDVVCEQVLGLLGATAVEEVHNHHNFSWGEEHDGERLHVTRKGATPARPGQRGFVGATMGEPAVILEGVDSPRSAEALFSTVHGAGRTMSRTEAAGRRRRRWACANRDCDWVQPSGGARARVCPRCGHPRVVKRWVQDRAGRVDWATERAALAAAGVELRGGGADEAPPAYKRLSDVLAAHAGTVRVLHTLRPIGVAMAGPEVEDPFKD